ncbi:MAG: SigB/SigF/SigG family RNA polymerase sigma factor [Eubacteriales bacterium]|nr:SigB/SigF/SigG family RNA polymerase sigma factor [Eubacteriales bacterium]
MMDAAPLPHEEVMTLIAAAQKQDTAAMEHLVTHNTALVKSIVKKFLGRGIEYDDLYQIGCLGLVKAINHYEASFGVRFSTYAVPMIAGEIKRFLRDAGMVKVSRSLKELASKAAAAQERLRRSLGRDPGIAELAKALEAAPEDVAMALEAARPHISLFEPLYDEHSDTTLLDQMQKESAPDVQMVDRILLKDLLSKLEARERQLIFLRYFQDKTQSEIAQLMGVSQVQISRMENRIIRKLREAVQEG